MKYINPFYYLKIIRSFLGVQERKIIFSSENEHRAREEKRKEIKENYRFIQNLSDEHVSFLEAILRDEENRFNTLETKLAQITGQSGIIFTLIALFIPFFYDSLNNFDVVWKIIFLGLFLISFVAFIISILLASDTLRANDFRYSRPDINTSLDSKIKDKATFVQNKVKDMITTIEVNTETNTSKGNLLISSNKAFTFGIISAGLLGVLLIILSFFNFKEEKIIIIKRPEDILNLKRNIQQSRALMELMIVSGITFSDSIKAPEINKKLDSLDGVIRKLK